jgi:hypothetical protein
MQFTNIDFDRLEKDLLDAKLALRNKLIRKALESVNTLLTPESTEVVELIAFQGFDFEQKFSLIVDEQLQLLEKMYDENHAAVSIKKVSSYLKKGFFGSTPIISRIQDWRYIFYRTAVDVNREVKYLQAIFTSLRNPRVMLSLEEHDQLVNDLKDFEINLADYYI